MNEQVQALLAEIVERAGCEISEPEPTKFNPNLVKVTVKSRMGQFFIMQWFEAVGLSVEDVTHLDSDPETKWLWFYLPGQELEDYNPEIGEGPGNRPPEFYAAMDEYFEKGGDE